MMSKDSVQVYCRLRPMQSPTDVSCMRVTSDTTVVITRPESADDFQMTFNHVFTSNATQGEIFETVALPLVENLIHGRNGLLFTYGVTGSGNTYTMTGERQDAGIMPQCLDVIFNTIANYQTEKFVSKPDKLNSFYEADAMLDRQHVLHAGPSQITGRLGERQKIDSDGDSNLTVAYERNESHSVVIEPDNAFAVIITFVEIYCSSVFDLLYEDDITSKHKIAIEDGNKNVYEDTFTEVEVKTAEEAFELFQRGQRKRRFAHTARTSDAELSSSHSVFTIRLVQTLLNCESEHVMQDKRIACVSQLSLVDFVGYEDMAENYCLRWLEAENLLRSLTTLRSYLEILREDQDTNKMVSCEAFSFPSLFKGCFDGQEQVRMIVCVNPRANDYDNTIQIMEFAEMIQEVYIARYDPVKLDVGFTPGRRQAIKEARSKLEKGGCPKAADLDIDLGLVYKYFVTSSGGSFPQLKTIPLDDDQMIHSLIQFLKQRLSKPHILGADLQTKQEDFGRTLMAVEQENVNLEAANTQQKTKMSALDGYKYDHLQSLKLQETMLIAMQQLWSTLDKLHLEKQILVDDNGINPVIVPSKEQELTTRVISPDRDSRISRKDRIPVSNPRYIRSQSADRWIDHRPQTLVPIGTVLQPLMQERRIVTRRTSSKEITDGVSTYCLVALEHDTDGEVETKLYKVETIKFSYNSCIRKILLLGLVTAAMLLLIKPLL